jgi:hypothetical protein
MGQSGYHVEAAVRRGLTHAASAPTEAAVSARSEPSVEAAELAPEVTRRARRFQCPDFC